MLVRLVLLILPLSLDNFAVSTLVGVMPIPLRARLRLAATFAAAEGLMPALGLLLGLPLGTALGEAGSYVAGVLVLATGLWIWRKEWTENDDDDDRASEALKIGRAAQQSGWALLALALSISLDEFAVGFSFGVLRLPVLPALLAIAVQAVVVSVVGQWVGGRLGTIIGERAERLVGPALCLLGLWLIAAQAFGLPI